MLATVVPFLLRITVIESSDFWDWNLVLRILSLYRTYGIKSPTSRKIVEPSVSFKNKFFGSSGNIFVSHIYIRPKKIVTLTNLTNFTHHANVKIYKTTVGWSLLNFFYHAIYGRKANKIVLLLNNKTSVFETSFKRSAFQLIKPKGKLNRSMTLFYRDLWWNYEMAVLT